MGSCLMHVIFASYGNDSIALIQWAKNYGIGEAIVAYSDTGWAAKQWPERVNKAEDWVRSLGYTTHRIASEGMTDLVRRKKAWPRGGDAGRHGEVQRRDPARLALAAL